MAAPQTADRGTTPAREGPRASIVIPCYNQARWLGEAIASVRAQTYGSIETIVVDDGSQDDTAGVCAAHPEIRYVRQDNRGLSAARNAGLAVATGEYVCFLDADDLLRPDAIAQGVAALDANPDWGFVYAGHVGVLADRTPLWETRPERARESYRGLLEANFIGMHATVIYRRDLLERAGGFDVGLEAAEDYDVYLRLARRHSFGSHDTIAAEYRRHDGNMSEDPSRMLRACLKVLARQEPFVADSLEDRAALRRGIGVVEAFYGGPLVRKGLRDLVVRERRAQALARLAEARRLAPRSFAHALRDTGRERGARAAKALVRALPAPVGHLARRLAGREPLAGAARPVRFGDLRRTTPIDPDFGFARGLPIDRHYIEGFLARNADAIAGRVLEIGDAAYTKRFGGERVTHSDVLHVHEDAPEATIVGDLENAEHIASDTFDCIVLTQTLHLVFDMRKAVATLHRILKPGGILLLTVPGISQVDRGEWGDTWYWSLTGAAVRRLLGEGWSPTAVETHGNVLAASAFLYGLAAHELTPEELAAHDPAYPMIVAARAAKAAEATP